MAMVVASAAAVTLWAGVSPVKAAAQTDGERSIADQGRGRSWVASWEAPPHAPEAISGPEFNCPSEQGLTDATVRNIVYVHAGGDRMRLRLSNGYGTAPLRVGSASVALSAGDGNIVPGTARAVTFGGNSATTIPVGADAISDSVGLDIPDLSALALSVHVDGVVTSITEHFDASQDSYLASGDQVAEAALTSPERITCWIFATGVDVRSAGRVTGTVVTLGDSITEQTTTNANNRYPDFLARRLLAQEGNTLSVANAGIAGNGLTGQPGPSAGEAAGARFDRDVLAQTGVTDVILLEGINDIGQCAVEQDIIDAQQQIIARAHAAGLSIYGGTLMPMGGTAYGLCYGTAASNAVRQKVNAWIRHKAPFDGVIDFDQALHDPQHPDRLLPAYDTGDHIHPNDVGTERMAQLVDIRELRR